MNAKEQAQARWDHVAKPLNSLGKLEKLIVMIAGVQNTPDVRIDKRCALVFCGDHGVVAEGVSQSGSEVTGLVAKSIAEGTANINLWPAHPIRMCSRWTWGWSALCRERLTAALLPAPGTWCTVLP